MVRRYLLFAFASLAISATVSAASFQIGDVFAGVGNGRIAVYRPDGTLVQVLNTTTNSSEMTGMAFDTAGNLYATGFQSGTISKFDVNGNLLSANILSGTPSSQNRSSPLKTGRC